MAYEQQIAKGVALLDEKVPGWLDRVDSDLLDMRAVDFPVPEEEDAEFGRAGCGCVLSQLDLWRNARPEGSYYSEAKHLRLSTAFNEDSDDHASRYGFTLPPAVVVCGDFDAAIDALTAEWVATIARLRAERAK